MFDETYEAVIADTPLGRRIHHRIRYAVYCLETGFERPDLHPDGEERDPWDAHSVHLLVRHRGSGHWVGAMRLIRPVSGGILPIHSLSDAPLDAAIDHNVAEVSRLCILGEHRRAVGETLTDPGSSGRNGGSPLGDLNRFSADRSSPGANTLPLEHPPKVQSMRGEALRLPGPEIMAGLLRAAMEYSRDHGIRHWYFLTNPALARLVRRMKVDIVRVGETCFHRGLRHPYLIDLNDAVFSASRRCSKMARLLSDGEPYRLFSELGPEPKTALREVAAA